MKTASALIGMAISVAACAHHEPLPVVKDVDLGRYAGRWHEIAAIPARFERDCAGDATADYVPAADGTIKVTNACRRPDGERKEATGTARPVGAPGEGSLQVSFLSVAGEPVWIAAGDYRIVALDKDYRWSVVAHPSRDYAWILARAPTLTAPTLRDMREWLAAVGYDTCRLVVTANPAKPRLCDV